LGYNYRMTELQAAIGVEQLKKLDFLNKWQEDNFNHLAPKLPKCIKPPYIAPYAKPTFYIVGCVFDESEAGIPRDEFVRKCTEANLHEGRPRSFIGGGYGCVTYNLPFYRKFERSCPNAEEMVKNALWLDVVRWPNRMEDLDRLVDGFKGILG